MRHGRRRVRRRRTQIKYRSDSCDQTAAMRRTGLEIRRHVWATLSLVCIQHIPLFTLMYLLATLFTSPQSVRQTLSICMCDGDGVRACATALDFFLVLCTCDRVLGALNLQKKQTLFSQTWQKQHVRHFCDKRGRRPTADARCRKQR